MNPPRRRAQRSRSSQGRRHGASNESGREGARGRSAAPVVAADGATHLARAVRDRGALSWSQARLLVCSGKVFVDGRQQCDPLRPLGPDETFEIRPSAPRPTTERLAAFARDAIVYLDAALVVVNKPAGVSTIAFGEEDRSDGATTLDAMVREALAARTGRGGRSSGRPTLGVVHRIDKQTSGLVVFTRQLLAKKHLGQQFRVHSVHRRYLAIVHGRLGRPVTLRTHLVADRGDGMRGSAPQGGPGGQLAVTHVEPLEPLEGATLVACRLETGRTHQIRIHLSEAGHPLVGEPVYIREFSARRVVASRLMLHAAELGFVHPSTGRAVRLSVAPPPDFDEVLARLRTRAEESQP